MHKKLMLACMAIASFAAFVIAPAARGATLTENGTALAVGSSITAKNAGYVKFTGGFGVQCGIAHLQGTVTANSGSTFAGEIPVGSATFTNVGGGACESRLGATTVKVTSKLCLHVAKGSDTMSITGCAGNVKLDLTAAGVVCEYETAVVSASFLTNTTPTTATVFTAPFFEVGGKFFCPDFGELDMLFDLYTTGGFSGLTLS